MAWLIIIIALLVGFGGWTAYQRHDAAVVALAEQKEKAEQAQKQVDEIAQKYKAEVDNKLIDMEAAYDAGEKEATEKNKTAASRAKVIISNNPVFSNTQCVIPADALALLNAARASIRTGTLPPEAIRADVPTSVTKVDSPPPTPAAPGNRPKPKPLNK